MDVYVIKSGKKYLASVKGANRWETLKTAHSFHSFDAADQYMIKENLSQISCRIMKFEDAEVSEIIET